TDTPALHAWISAAVSDFGRLDGIINNAGLSVIAPFADCPEADFDRVMAVNFDAVVKGCRLALPHIPRPGRRRQAGVDREHFQRVRHDGLSHAKRL
ncbi:MAG: SDR family NAD(P)-dependent oxidoreductase, partial [Sandaracinobacter sp.]